MAQCFCGKWFNSDSALGQHQDAKGVRYCCPCGKRFRSDNGLGAHQRAKAHSDWSVVHNDGTGDNFQGRMQPECSYCDCWFGDHGDLEDHVAIEHPDCDTCGKTFSGDDELEQHQHATGHCYCVQCERIFTTAEGLRQHNRTYIHEGYECVDCGREFVTQEALNQHMRDAPIHQRAQPAQPAQPMPTGQVYTVNGTGSGRLQDLYTCEPCNRQFKGIQAYTQHILSPRHTLSRNIVCPLSKGCQQQFATPSALIMHLESGSCKSGMNVDRLNALVLERDTDRLITNGNTFGRIKTIGVDNIPLRLSNPCPKMAATNAGGMYSTLDLMAQVERSRISLQVASSALSGSDPNPQSLDHPSATAQEMLARKDGITSKISCPFCPPGRTYKTAADLRQHLASMAHAPKMFKCPAAALGHLGLSGHRDVSFTTLSGMVQHIEASAYRNGAEGLRKSIGFLETQMKGLGFGDMRLLL